MSGDRANRSKLRVLDPGQLRPRLKLPAALASLPDEIETPNALLDRLVERGMQTEAARLLAYALPPREAVWWACRCVEHAAPAGMAAVERAAIEAAEAWVRAPDEATRQRAAWAAAGAGYGAPGAWAALGAYWCSANLQADLRAGRGAETAIGRALERAGGATREQHLATFIASGRHIARGGAGRVAPVAAQ